MQAALALLSRKQYELLAAVAGDVIRGPHGLVEYARDPGQHLVAELVSVPVVDELGNVDVDHQHRERSAIAQGAVDRPRWRGHP
ncbi:MAG: hypothetical protein U0360_05115 [Dehalococcoidia bacterium]